MGVLVWIMAILDVEQIIHSGLPDGKICLMVTRIWLNGFSLHSLNRAICQFKQSKLGLKCYTSQVYPTCDFGQIALFGKHHDQY